MRRSRRRRSLREGEERQRQIAECKERKAQEAGASRENGRAASKSKRVASERPLLKRGVRTNVLQDLPKKRELNAKCLELARDQLVKKECESRKKLTITVTSKGVVLPLSTAKVERPSDGRKINRWKADKLKKDLRERALEASEHIMERADEIAAKLLDDRDLNDLDERAVQREVTKLRETGYVGKDVVQQAQIIVRGKIEYQRKVAEENRAKMDRRVRAKEAASQQGKQVKKEIMRRKHLEEGARANHQRANRNKETGQDITFGLVEMERQMMGEIKSISSEAALGCVYQLRFEQKFQSPEDYRTEKQRLKDAKKAERKAAADRAKEMSRAERKEQRRIAHEQMEADRAEKKKALAQIGDISLTEFESGQDRLRRSGAKIRQEVGKLRSKAKQLNSKAKKTQKKIDGMKKKTDKKRKTARKGQKGSGEVSWTKC